jgi:fumarylacetoacetase
MSDVKLGMPLHVHNYSDFYTSLYHALNIGKIFGIKTEGSNFEWIPIAYHGRASSIGISGQKLHRPYGQLKGPAAEFPRLAPTEKLDYESELAIYIGQGNELGQRIPLDEADEHIFGIGLLNDWSARDIQSWEMHPLGPFLAKSFATTISPWIITLDALAPFRTAPARSPLAPQPLPYLDSRAHREGGALDIQMEVWIESVETRRAGAGATRLSHTSFKHQYWTAAQMVTHHTVNGCNLQIGDLLGSGTVSGPSKEEAGALIELTEDGVKPVVLENGERRTFIEDGDVIILQGFCERDGFIRIGFGECRGEVLRSLSVPA